MQTLTWILLVVVLGWSLLKGIPLSSGQISVMVMILLLSLSKDLREFNFMGLKGKKYENDIKKLEGEKAIPDEQVKIDHHKLDEAEKSPAPIQLMDTSQGNFLALAFEIERLLRMFGTVSLAKDVPPTMNLKKLTAELKEADLLTDIGVKQVEAIQWIRNILVHGRQSEINQPTLDTGIEIAYSLYGELYKKLYGQEPPI